MKHTMTAVAIAASLVGSTAGAVVFNGTFNIDIYNYDAGGVAANANADAATVAANAVGLVGSIVYVGDLDFETTDATFPNPTIAQFLSTGGGTFDPTGLDILLTNGGFQTTTLFDIMASNLGFSFDASAEHDDGITAYDDGVAVTPASAASPTVAVDSTFSFNGGDFRLIYSAANGNPEVLSVDIDNVAPVVPLPAAAWFLVSGVAALGASSRRKRRAV